MSRNSAALVAQADSLPGLAVGRSQRCLHGKLGRLTRLTIVLTISRRTGNQPDRAVDGPLSHAIRLEYRGPVNTFGIRFHPARGAAFLGQLATSLTDKLLPLAQVSTPLDRTLSRLVAGDWSPDEESCRAALDQALLDQLV